MSVSVSVRVPSSSPPPRPGEDGLGMDVAGTQLVEKDIENLARGEAGARPAAGRGAAGPGEVGGGWLDPPASPRGSRYLCFLQE